MIEMFDVNNLNTTASSFSSLGITNLIENVNQSNNANNNENLLLSPSASETYGLSTTSVDSSNTMLFTDFVVNTTAIVVDYATQWLTTTIATTAANLTNISNETKTTDAVSASYSSSFISADSYLNYSTNPLLHSNSSNSSNFSGGSSSNNSSFSYTNFTNPAFLNNATNTNNNYSNNNNIMNTSYSSATFIATNTDLIGENTKLADDGNYYDELNDCHPANPNFNCSRMDFILFALGPQSLPLYKCLMITILYGGIFITGFLGNVLVCIVIVKHSAMHTATNYYLFSLAVSDLIYLIFGLPTEVFLYWHQYPYLFGLPFCKARAYISEASTYVSVLTIVAFSVERYLAICHPLHLYAMSGFKRALRIIAILWVFSFLGALPFGIWTNINYLDYPPDNSSIVESGFCAINDGLYNIPLFEYSSLVFFFIPMFLIFYFYGRMGAKICSRTTQQLGVQQGSMHRESRHQQSRKAVIKMLAAVVVTFFICWLPFHIQRLWFVHGKDHKYYQEVNEWLFSFTGFAYYVTCTINPILYNVMSHRYRVAFKDILCGKRKNVYYNNGFARDQSSFRDTTIVSSLGNNSTYDRVHSVRVRSVRIINNVKDRTSLKSNNISWKKDFNTPMEKDIPENHSTNLSGTNAVVVCVDNGVNGRTKVYTENEAHETLLNKNNETCI